jgi:hypothetical protein
MSYVDSRFFDLFTVFELFLLVLTTIINKSFFNFFSFCLFGLLDGLNFMKSVFEDIESPFLLFFLLL